MKKITKNNDYVCHLYNDLTGEIAYSLREGDSVKLYTREQKEYKANHIKIKEKSSFVKVYKDTIMLLINENLSKSEYEIIFIAMTYLDTTSGILTENGVNINKIRFMELTNLSHNTFTNSINHLIDLQIMARTKIGRTNVYLLNPFIFLNGVYINATLYGIFKKSKWNLNNE